MQDTDTAAKKKAIEQELSQLIQNETDDVNCQRAIAMFINHHAEKLHSLLGQFDSIG